MGIHNELSQIRVENQSTTKQKVFSIVCAITIGLILGLAAKLVDAQGINPIFDAIGGRLGIWIFVATLISVFSYSPKLAAVKVFFFFVSLLTVYYLYTVFFLHFFPRREIVFWGMCAVVSPMCAYVMWYARGNGRVSSLVVSLPITALLSEGYQLRDAYLPEHTHYYLIPILMVIYLIMAIVLLFIIPTSRLKFLIILPISILLSFIIIYFNVLGQLFGGLNGVL
ncbi:hypothetical protein BS614_23500 [Paenibacillus xylanexedens]|uniref:hypothetical protein n=1 Tax=Paenibacillus xylanexedens TaxID=528191 RepID=UPI0009386756|nr:hypothetical protein [Paenibacillus xylanexedens]APO46715.1 hypothetical protein BS614_23500 [Paenibacillus xylanexedens]